MLMIVQQYLANRKIWYEPIVHWPTYDAQRLAQAVHTSGDLVAKTVVLRADDEYLLAVLPATHLIELPKVKQLLRAEELALATELEFNELFPDCEIGALPPFGSQYGLTTLVDRSLASETEIVFEGNSHQEAIRMKFTDFARLENPVVTHFAYKG